MIRPVLLALGAVAVTAAVAHATPTTNGSYVNGSYVNGSYVNTALVNGSYVNGSSVAAMSVPSFGTLYGVHLENSRIVGTAYPYGPWWPFRIDNVVGATLWADLVNAAGNPNGTAQMRIDAMRQGTGNDADVTYYNVKVLQKIQRWTCSGLRCYPRYVDEWNPICGYADGLEVEVIPVNGVWDYRQGHVGAGGRIPGVAGVTFACTNGAIGKCVDQLEYKPWRSYLVQDGGTAAQIPLTALHDACVRMIRADYCGNGISRTVNGTEIEAADSVSPSINELSVPEMFNNLEAVWTPDGASCLAAARHQALMGASNGCVCGFRPSDNLCMDGGGFIPFETSGNCAIPDDRLFNFSRQTPIHTP